MRHLPTLATLILTAACLTACGNASQKLQGTWAMDSADAAKALGKPPTLEITADQITLDEMGSTKLKYRVLKTDGHDITLEADPGLGRPYQFVATINGDTLTFDPSKNQNPMLAGTHWKRQ